MAKTKATAKAVAIDQTVQTPAKAAAKPVPVGPRGSHAPLDTLSEQQKAENEAQREARLQQGMSSTDAVDSRGLGQHVYPVTKGGLHSSGAKLEDTVHRDQPPVEEAPAQVGPRGASTPADTHHGGKPGKPEPANLKGW